jgi:hypothetical protein
MTVLKTKVKAGRIEFDAPVDWPNGMTVEIRPALSSNQAEEDVMSPEEIARTLAAMQDMIPPDAESDFHSVLESMTRERKAQEKAEFLQYGEQLKKVWD